MRAIEVKFSKVLRAILLFSASACSRRNLLTSCNRGNRISLTNVGKVALYFTSFLPVKGDQKSQPSCETGSTICAAVLQPHTGDNFPRGGCTDVHTNAMHLEPARSFAEHPLEAFTSHASFDLDVPPTEQRRPWSAGRYIRYRFSLRVRETRRKESRWNAFGMHAAVSLTSDGSCTAKKLF